MLFLELYPSIFIFLDDVIFILLIELLDDLGLEESAGTSKISEETVVVRLNTVKFEPLSHEADLCLDIVLQEESLVFISNDETNVEMNLFAKSLILNKAFSYHEDQSNDVTDNDHCCKSKMNKDAKYNSYYSYYEESQKKIE